MIRQRNCDPRSEVGVKEYHREVAVSAAAVAAQAYMGTPIANAEKVQLLELIVAVDVVVVGGGTLTFNIGKGAGNTRGITAGTVVKAAVLTGVSAVGIYRADLSDIPPIDPKNPLLLAAQPNNLWLQAGWVNAGTVTTVTFGFKLRYKVFQVGKD
jgi:hypothetical protein